MHGIKRTNLTRDARELKIQKDAIKITKYNKLKDAVLMLKENEKYNDKSLELTTKLLNFNPELYTVWNFRRDILINYKFKEIETEPNPIDKHALHKLFKTELDFVLAQLYKYPKCYWIWDHRRWCLLEDQLSDWNFELGLVDKFFQADSRNLHVWQYRRFIIHCFKESLIDANLSRAENNLRLCGVDWDEFKFTAKMINKDISNYSAWHNRSKLIENLFTQSPSNMDDADIYLNIFKSGDRLEFLKKELELIKTAFYTDPEDSSVWFYLKWLFSDYYLETIPTTESIILMEQTIQDINELNELETGDNGVENQWCLKSTLFLLKKLIEVSSLNTPSFEKLDSWKNGCNEICDKLIELDPMRIRRYKEAKI